MNATIMHNIEQEMLHSIVVDAVEVQEPKRVEPITKLLQRIDDTDLIKAHNHYAQLLDQSSQEILSRMRHRATMLRDRANQLDKEADDFEHAQEILSQRNLAIMEDIEEIENILHSLAHIEPQRT